MRVAESRNSLRALGVAFLVGIAPILASCAQGADPSGDSPGIGDDAGADAKKPKDSGTDAKVRKDSSTGPGDDTGDDDDSGGGSGDDDATTGDDDDASTGDDDATTGDDDTGDDDTGDDDTGADDASTGGNDASTGGDCGGLVEWTAGTTAQHVKHNGEKYTCLVPGWCSLTGSAAIAAYEPGKGTAWSQAWQDNGSCQ